ncbi:MAG: DUF192 domain-containing protein [Candidatus Aminicenantes bacterium]|nr:MAG: DUF192 domain-containing protein [Candidatus Aminicenantes bacterium]
MLKQNKRPNISVKLFFFGAALFLALSSAQTSREKFVKIFLPNGTSITAELAITDEERQRGLMFRDALLPDQGMLLVFEEEDIYYIWMKNMKFSIDILWLDREKRIVHVEKLVPPCKKDPCPSYHSKIPSMYVLELKAGSADKNKLKLYDRLDFILPIESQNR